MKLYHPVYQYVRWTLTQTSVSGAGEAVVKLMIGMMHQMTNAGKSYVTCINAAKKLSPYEDTMDTIHDCLSVMWYTSDQYVWDKERMPST